MTWGGAWLTGRRLPVFNHCQLGYRLMLKTYSTCLSKADLMLVQLRMLQQILVAQILQTMH